MLIVLIGVLPILLFSGCSDTTTIATPDQSPNNETAAVNDQTTISADNDLANKWLKQYCVQLDQYVGNRQCTEVARKFTDAKGYGTNGLPTPSFIGGYEFIKTQQAKIIETEEAKGKDAQQVQQAIEKAFPTLAQYIEQNRVLKRCDNLVLTGAGYDAVGHTAVIFAVDVKNDNIWYLDQNYGTYSVKDEKTGEIKLFPNPLKLRFKKINTIKNTAYVIPANCKTPEDIGCPKPEDSLALPLQQLDIQTQVEDKPIFHGDIIFTSSRDGNRDIYSMRADGRNIFNLTDNNDTNNSPSISPDGTLVVYIANDKIARMDADGNNQAVLFEECDKCYSPHWSPNGDKIAFVSNFDGRQDIFVMNSDGDQQINLTENGKSNYDSPSWSPDGSKIAYISMVDGYSDLFIMNADGSEQRNLTNNSKSKNNYPAWSPDGMKIAYFSSHELDGLAFNGINIMFADGSDIKPFSEIDVHNDVISMAWSPNGQKIVYELYEKGLSNLYIIDSNGGSLKQLTNNNYSEYSGSPSWSPDGQMIVYTHTKLVNKPLGVDQIYIMSADGSNQRNLTPDADGFSPNWSPISNGTEHGS